MIIVRNRSSGRSRGRRSRISPVLNIDLIAEGVETEQQVDLLKSWGCGAAQGFYFARPMPAEEIARPPRADKG
jgi:EAL domain-containing protein (putative c-di-GMP-specific phosphodiesterase class I)